MVELQQNTCDADKNSDAMVAPSASVTTDADAASTTTAAAVAPNESQQIDANANILVDGVNNANSQSVDSEKDQTATPCALSTTADATTDTSTNRERNSEKNENEIERSSEFQGELKINANDAVDVEPVPVCEPLCVKRQVYRVEFDDDENAMDAKMPALKKCRSLDGEKGFEFGIDELSDVSSAAGDNENTPIVSEAESDLDESNEMIAVKSMAGRLISEQTLPLDRTLNVSPVDGVNPTAFSMSTLNIDRPLTLAIDPSETLMPTQRQRQAHLLSVNSLDVIREENSDASDVEVKTDAECQHSADEAKVKNVDAVYPKSHFDFTSVGRHTNLVTPKTEVIREEPQLMLVDAKFVEHDGSEEGSSKMWTISNADKQHHAEVVFIDSSSSSGHTSLSDVEASGTDDRQSVDLDSEVRIETPIIGSHFGSAFKPVPINSNRIELPVCHRDGDLSPLRRFLNLPPPPPPTTPTIITTSSYTEPHLCVRFEPISKPIEKLGHFFQSFESTQSDHESSSKTFKPINENDESILDQLRNVLASSTSSLNDDSQRQSPSIDGDSESMSEKIARDEPITFDSRIHTDATHPTQTHPEFKIGEPCSIDMFGANSLPSGAAISVPVIDTNLSAISNLSKHILGEIKTNELFNRQDSASSSHCSSQSQQSQCTAVFCADDHQCDLRDFCESYCLSETTQTPVPFDGGDPLKSLRQLCIDCLTSLPYGLAILEELAKVASTLNHLTAEAPANVDMPYPAPRLPHIGGLEIVSPTPPPRTHKANVKLISNFAAKSPPPIPERPWLGIPTHDDPNVLVCLSPAQRQLLRENDFDVYYRYNNSADCLLDAHNKFVDRRGYYEYTDDEVNAINFKQQPKQPNGDTDNRLLALIREINQLTNASTADDDVNRKNSSAVTHPEQQNQTTSSDGGHTDQQIFAHEQSESDRATEKMSAAFGFGSDPMRPTSFNSRRFSNLYDELSSRLNPIAEEPQPRPKRFSNIETSSSYESSRKRIENGKIVYECSDSRSEKKKESEKSECDANDKRFAADANYRRYDECKNKRAEEEEVEKEEGAQSGESERKNESGRFSFKEFDYVPKFFSDFFGRSAHNQSTEKSASEVKTETINQNFASSSGKTVAVEREAHESQQKPSQRVLSPPPPPPMQKASEHHLSTQSLFDFRDFRAESAGRDLGPSANAYRGRISPCVQIRAPRITEVPARSKSSLDHNESQRQYDWHSTSSKHSSRQYENRQSMIDQTPITRHVSTDYDRAHRRRQSLPKEISKRQMDYILAKEIELGHEYDKLERDRQRLLKELEEMRVNQCFEESFKQHKLRNSSQPLTTLSEAELLRKQMQDEWLNKVGEREQRRLNKIIKITNSNDDVGDASKSQTHRGLCDEFLDRVRERRHKLEIPSDSDWESGAESQPQQAERVSPNIDPAVKVVDGERETDLKKLPRHLKEFAEIVATNENGDVIESTTTTTTERTSTTTQKEIIHKIEQRTDDDEGTIATATGGESVVSLPVKLMLFGLCFVVSAICWHIYRYRSFLYYY